MTPSRRYLALDVGDARIGLALSDESGTIATPAGIIQRSAGAPEQAVLDHAARARADAIIVGFPLQPDGTAGPQARKVMRFVRQLRAIATGQIPIITFDESHSTAQARALLIEAGASRSRRAAPDDAAAAAVILQDYLAAGLPPPQFTPSTRKRRRSPPSPKNDA